MLWRILFLILFSFGCRYTQSPYTSDAPDINLNDEYLSEIGREEASTPANFKIAFLADTHNYFDKLERAIKKINSRGPFAFVVVAGDITNLGLVDEFRKTDRLLARLKFPYLVAAGNHDMLANGSLIFSRMYGPDQLSFTFKNVQIILFNNNNWEVGGSLPYEWVETELAATPAPFKILIAHVAFDDKNRFSNGEINRWINIINANAVNYVMTGHNHNPSVKSFGSATQITIGAPSKNSYFELSVSAGGITHEKISF